LKKQTNSNFPVGSYAFKGAHNCLQIKCAYAPTASNKFQFRGERRGCPIQVLFGEFRKSIAKMSRSVRCAPAEGESLNGGFRRDLIEMQID
jgi:hypothetical protein